MPAELLLVSADSGLCSVVSGLGMDTRHAGSGSAALELLCEQEPAVVLLSARLPDMKALELARLIHGDNTRSHVPIILLADHGEWEDMVYCAHEAGILDYLPRPLRRGILIGKLRLYRELYESRLRGRQHLEQLRLSNQELRDFAHAAAHDLRSPLRTITTHLRQLEEAPDRPESEVVNVRAITRGSWRMERMLSDMLEYAKVDAVKRSDEAVDLSECLGEVIADLQSQIAHTRGRVQCEALPTLCGSRSQMHRLFQNLVGNALKYHRPGVLPRVRVEARSRENRVEISVWDNGTGFDMRWHDDVFRPFRRLVPSSRGGSGIGMATAKRIVERHGGSIWARSVVGEGSTFFVELPLTAKELAAFKGRQAASDGPTLVVDAESAAAGGVAVEPGREAVEPARWPLRPCVLVVDDDDDDRESAAAAMRGRFEVLKADSAERAMELLGPGSGGMGSDLVGIISDYRMPGQSGLWLLAQAARGRAGIRRILMTGCPDDECGEALSAGIVDCVIEKPAEPGALASAFGIGL